jgi:hypothetical protein
MYVDKSSSIETEFSDLNFFTNKNTLIFTELQYFLSACNYYFSKMYFMYNNNSYIVELYIWPKS